MKGVISTTYDDKYLFYLPIVTWCWNKLGVDVIFFMPYKDDWQSDKKLHLVIGSIPIQYGGGTGTWFEMFKCPEHKEATYAQCSRLYASCIAGLSEHELLIISDIDMALFKIPDYDGGITIFGKDLVPDNQYPMCYISGTVKSWRAVIYPEGKTYQEHLDELLGGIEAEHFRGNYWGKDQETAYNMIHAHPTLVVEKDRARQGTQFAKNRLDRDDSYLLDRLDPDIIDYHLPRPGYEENNFQQIMTVLKYFYPQDDLTWIEQYREQYIKLL